ncbi:arylsulfatase, partial [Streptomyces sp. OfavH-34-F]|nr:arylsulfatase [Streptomyces sp. OfavH-34-F]
MALALLHTSPVHVPVFDALRDAHHPGLPLHHVVREELLAGAAAGEPEAVAGEVTALVAELAARGAAAVLCTCSTIGAVAEAAGSALAVPVLRVDRPM